MSANSPDIQRPTFIGERPISWTMPVSFVGGLFIAVWLVTEFYGWRFSFNPSLGPKLLHVIYEPFQIFVWLNQFYSPFQHITHKPFPVYPKYVYDQFRLLPYVAGGAFLVGVLFAAIVSLAGQKGNNDTSDLYDSGSKWASEKMAAEDKLLGGKAGPIIGGLDVGGRTKPLRYGGELGITYTESPGGGKALDVNTPILTPCGYRTIGDISVGDSVIASDGRATRVIGVFPQGMLDAYRVTFSDGAWTICCDQHLWSVQSKTGRLAKRPAKILPLSRIRELLGGAREQGYRLAVPLVAPVEFESRQCDVDPYVVGVLLGDGCMRSKSSPSFTSADKFIVEEVGRLVSEADLEVISDGSPYGYRIVRTDRRTGRECAACEETFEPTGSIQKYCLRCRASARTQSARESSARRRSSLRGRRALQASGRPSLPPAVVVGRGWHATYGNAVGESFAREGLCVRSEAKFVPAQYKFGSVATRVSLLQGLFDTDGSAHHTGCIVEYTTTSEQLASDVTFMIQSLGGTAAVARRRTTFRHNGELRTGRLSYRIHVKVPSSIIPFRLPRKVSLCRQRSKYQILRMFERIEFVGRREMVCIAVDAPDHLYVVQDCIVTHNSSFLKSNLLIPLRHQEAAKWSERERRLHPWGEEPVIIASDPKFELHRETSGYQSEALRKNVKLLAPLGVGRNVAVDQDQLASYNPFWSIRLGTDFGFQDALYRTLSIIDAEGEGLKTHWDRTALGWGAAVIEKLGFRAINLGDPEIFSLPGLLEFVSGFGNIAKLLEHMLNEPDDPAGVFGWQRSLPDGRQVPTTVKPSILQATLEMMQKEAREQSGVYSSFIAFMAPYRSDVLRRYITKSTFDWSTLANDRTRSATVYIGMDPMDIPKCRSYLRMVTGSAVEELTSGGTLDMGGRSARGNFRPVVLMMDEAAAWRRLQEIEHGSGYFRGYGLYLWLIWQSVAQQRKYYGKENLLDETMDVLMYGRPKTQEGAEFIQELLGERTELVRKRSLAGGRWAVMAPQAQDTIDAQRLPVLSTKEILQLDKDRYFVFFNGHNYYLRKWEYYKNKTLSQRARIPYVKTFDADATGDPLFVQHVESVLTHEQMDEWMVYIRKRISQRSAASPEVRTTNAEPQSSDGPRFARVPSEEAEKTAPESAAPPGPVASTVESKPRARAITVRANSPAEAYALAVQHRRAAMERAEQAAPRQAQGGESLEPEVVSFA